MAKNNYFFSRRQMGRGHLESLLLSYARGGKKRIRQTPSTSKFKGLTSSQLRKLQKEN